MVIVERAFSYGGLLVRTFHHAEELPPAAATEAPSRLSTSEKQSRGGPRKKRKTIDADPALTQHDPSAPLTPNVTSPEGSSQCDREPNSASLRAQPRRSEYVHLLAPEELRAMQLRNRRSKTWIPGDLAIKKELDRLGRRESWVEVSNGIKRDTGPVQEVGCATEASARIPDSREDWSEDYGLFPGMDYSTAGVSVESLGHSVIQTGELSTERGSEHIHPSPPRPMLPSPVAISTNDGHQGLYLLPLSTHVVDHDPIAAPAPSLLVTLPLPNQLRDHSPASIPLQENSSLSESTSSNPPPKHGRGRPWKSPDLTNTPIPPPPTIPTFTPPTPSQSPPISGQEHASPNTVSVPTSVPTSKRPADPKPTSLPLPSVSSFLSHLTTAITTAQSGFIPRPVNASYTLPLPTLETEYKSFAISLVAQISQIDEFQWTIAHSQWTPGKGRSTSARWVCNLSEDGVRDRSARTGTSQGVGGCKVLDGANRKQRFPCGGAIAIRFTKQGVTVRYAHHAVHAPPKDLSEQTQVRRLEEQHSALFAGNLWKPNSGPPLPSTVLLGQGVQESFGGAKGWP